MRQLLIPLSIVVCAVPCGAQTPVAVGRPASLVWDQAAPDLDTANGYVYTVLADGAPVPIASTACTGSVSPFVCVTPFPLTTLGLHTVHVLAGEARVVPILFSAPSDALSVRVVGPPSTPGRPVVRTSP